VFAVVATASVIPIVCSQIQRGVSEVVTMYAVIDRCSGLILAGISAVLTKSYDDLAQSPQADSGVVALLGIATTLLIVSAVSFMLPFDVVYILCREGTHRKQLNFVLLPFPNIVELW
jgi:hypothetical protein